MPSIQDSLVKDIRSLSADYDQIDDPSMPHAGAEPTFPVRSRFLASPLPLSATYQPDALRQFYRGGIPQSRIFPNQK